MDSTLTDLVERAAASPQAFVRRAAEELAQNCEASGIALESSHIASFLKLATQGRYPALALARHPDELVQIVELRGRKLELEEHLDLLDTAVAEVETFESLQSVLRAHKRAHSLRVFLREIEGVASVRETVAEIATIAEATLRVALREAARLQGKPALADDLCVLGMGKLGGRELNFSSDIDLILLCRDDAAVDPDRKAEVDQLARSMVRAMEETTSDGYVFRVDLRLRPEGAQGPLVPSESAFVAYYLSWGRTWERSAMIKARPVAGALEIGERALQDLEPFIYRKYLDYESIDDLRAMKAMIHENAQISAIVGVGEAVREDDPDEVAEPPQKRSTGFGRRGAQSRRARLRRHRSRRSSAVSEPTPEEPPADMARPDPRGVRGWDVKIGVGGIREIEFFVQALQLVHCGTRPGLRVKNTLEALDRILYAGLLSHDDHARLADAYDFFRRLEHRVQMEDDRQTHRLPLEPEHFERLGTRLGYDDAASLTAEVDAHRDATRALFDRLFDDGERDSASSTVRQEGPTAIQTVMGAPTESLNDEVVLQALRQIGFARPRQVAGQIEILRSKAYGPFSVRRKPGTEHLGRFLLEVAGAAPDADQAFSYLTRFMTTVGDRPGYYRMLADNPHATRLLAHVFGSSAYLSNPLIQDPNVFERLLGVGTFAVMRTEADLVDDLDERCSVTDDPAHRLGLVRRFHQEETLRIGIHETGGAARIEQTTQQLSLLAETVIQKVLQEVYEPLRTRRRRPGSVLPELDEIPFAVVAMGKLGGRELGFGSDLDILFVYENDRQWRLEHSFFARLAQRLVRTLSMASAQGKLYEVDTRLRPSGNQGALVVSADAFDTYHREKAELWERQALLRARPVVGPGRLLEQVAKIRYEHAIARPAPDDVRQQVSAMRDRILENLRPVGAEDVKFSPGGLVDIEFLVQAVQLELGGEPSEVAPHEVTRGIHSQSTGRALAALRQSDFDGFDAGQLATDYDWLRRVEARLRMTDQRGATVIPTDESECDVLARRLGYQGNRSGANFLVELGDLLERVVDMRDSYFSE